MSIFLKMLFTYWAIDLLPVGISFIYLIDDWYGCLPRKVRRIMEINMLTYVTSLFVAGVGAIVYTIWA